MRDVNRWGLQKERDLGTYVLNGYLGVAEEQSMFKQSRQLREIVEIDPALKDAVKDSTPIVEMVALLPIASRGEFETQFVPRISFDFADGHTHYKIITISADRMSAYHALAMGRNLDLEFTDGSKDKKRPALSNWKAEFVPDLSELEQMLLPSSKGHMILIATPIEPQRDQADFLKELWGSQGGNDTLKGPASYGSGATRGASVGDVSIGQGSRVGSGSVYEGELRQSLRGTTTIFHVRYFGVKPDQAAGMDLETLQRIAQTLGTFARLN